LIKSALLIGCGDIGANYDFDSDGVLTHAKALSKLKWIKNIDVFDTNISQVKKISKKYNFKALNSFEAINFQNYYMVCISTPTNTHYDYLKFCLNSKVPLIICEKPISNSILELDKILNLYKSNKSRIIVNYFRRFSTNYLKVVSEIENIEESLKKVTIKYNKGFLNNCGHAFDIIEFLTKTNLNPKNVKVLQYKYDFFKDDPTISANFISNNTEFIVQGKELKNKIFEINFSYDSFNVFLKNSGNDIQFYKNDYLNFEFHELLKDYMKDVYITIEKLFLNKDLCDNFERSIELNKKQILNFFK